MKKLLLSMVLSVLVVLTIAPGIGNASTKIDPNGSHSSSLSNSYDSRSYVVELKTAGRFKVDINSSIEKIEYRLYDISNDNRLDGTNYVSKGSESFTYDLAPGKYEVYFERYSSSYNGSFSFTTSFVSANETYTADNNTINIIRNSAPVPFGSKITGQIADNDSIDLYKVYLPASGRLTCNIHSDIYDEVEYKLYDGNVDTISGTNYVNRGDATYVHDLDPGVYYIEFEKNSYSYTGVYSFTLNYNRSGETYTGDNNTFNIVRNTAGIPLCKTITGFIADNDSNDIHKISIPKTGYYKLKVISHIEKIEFYMCDKNENTISNSYNYHEQGSRSYSLYLKKGTNYLIFSRYSSDYTGVYKFSLKPRGTKISSAKADKRKFTIKWKKGTGSGYEIKYAANKQFTKGVKNITVKKSKINKKTIKRLKRKTNYYVKIRTYVKSGGNKYYSSWSKVKRVKTK